MCTEECETVGKDDIEGKVNNQATSPMQMARGIPTVPGADVVLKFTARVRVHVRVRARRVLRFRLSYPFSLLSPSTK